MMMNSSATPDSDTAGVSSQGDENGRDNKTEEVSILVVWHEVPPSVQTMHFSKRAHDKVCHVILDSTG